VIESSVLIRAPVGDVFAYTTDLPRHREWQPDLERVDVVTPPPVAVGTHVMETRRMRTGAQTYEYEIDWFEPGRGWGYRTLSPGPTRPSARWTFTAADGLTRVTIRLELNPDGPAKLRSRWLERGARRRLDVHLARLKAMCEGTW
jgi:uncharacterized protein YndB with AHSA1/START domain